MNICFERDVLSSLVNDDMLVAYVRAATADQGAGVKVNGALWPHLSPPAKIGGVCRALVKMGLLVPMDGGVYQVATGGSRETATNQRPRSEDGAIIPQALQVAGLGTSEPEARMERQGSEDGHDCPEADLAALESVLDALPVEPKPSVGSGLLQPEVLGPELAPGLEERARELARQSWDSVPDQVKARVNYDFEEYWKASSNRFLREVAAA